MLVIYCIWPVFVELNWTVLQAHRQIEAWTPTPRIWSLQAKGLFGRDTWNGSVSQENRYQTRFPAYESEPEQFMFSTLAFETARTWFRTTPILSSRTSVCLPRMKCNKWKWVVFSSKFFWIISSFILFESKFSLPDKRSHDDGADDAAKTEEGTRFGGADIKARDWTDSCFTLDDTDNGGSSDESRDFIRSLSLRTIS